MEIDKPIIIRFELLENGIGMWANGKDQYHREDDHPAVLFPNGLKEYAVNNKVYKIRKSDGEEAFIDMEFGVIGEKDSMRLRVATTTTPDLEL